MERVRERLSEAEAVLSSLKELTGAANRSAVERDAAIMRFTYTFEAVWKTARRYLRQREALDAVSPKACAVASRRVGLLTDEQAQAVFKMANDRNLAVRTFKEAAVEGLGHRLPGHAAVLEAWLAAMKKGIEDA